MHESFKEGFQKTSGLSGTAKAVSSVKSLTKVPKNMMPKVTKPRPMNYETHALKTKGGMFGPGAGLGVR